MLLKNCNFFLHGGDWNPDQWLKYPEIIEQDFDLMDKAHCNTFSVGIFAWSTLEPEEGKYNFAWLDDILERCAKRNKKVFLATPSAARPAWMAKKYPETCIAGRDQRRQEWSARQTACFNSPVFREKVRQIDEALAKRYANSPALAGWHVSNEFSVECFCPECRKKFAEFLQKKYRTLENLNDRYWSAFWSHRFDDWSEVNPTDDCTDAGQLDFRRFVSETNIDFYRMEYETVRHYSDAPILTNMMGTFGCVDYWQLGKYCDFIADDCYPDWYHDGGVEHDAARFSMLHDYHYSMKRKPFLIMESCPNLVNYHKYYKLRRPGELEREQLMAIGHGADGTMYFQWRKSRNSVEKFHGAVVGHDSSDKSLCFNYVASYGEKLANIAEVLGSTREPQAAVIFDYDTRWAFNASKLGGGPQILKYEPTVDLHYRALWKHNVDLAVIDSEADFSPYKLIVAPMLFLIKPGVTEKMRKFVEDGGTFVMTCLSANVDENNACFFGGNPGGPELRKLFGIWAEEVDGLEPECRQSFDYQGVRYPVVDYAEYIHAEGAEVISVFNAEFYAGFPAITRNRVGKGSAIYLGARTELPFLHKFYGDLLKECGITPCLPGVPETISASCRTAADGTKYYFLLNLTDDEVSMKLPCEMENIWESPGKTNTVTLKGKYATVLRCRK